MGKPTDTGVRLVGWLGPVAFGGCLLLCEVALGHGSVVDEDDQCLIEIGFYRAHFTAYQPPDAGHREFCEDLPTVGETVFVMEYLHDSMREVAVDFRIVRDLNRAGRFARYSDIETLDLDEATVYYREPAVQTDAVFTVWHDFDAAGPYIGVVSAADPESGELLTAVFPFSVARVPWEYGYFGVALVGLVVVGLWLKRFFFNEDIGVAR